MRIPQEYREILRAHAVAQSIEGDPAKLRLAATFLIRHKVACGATQREVCETPSPVVAGRLLVLAFVGFPAQEVRENPALHEPRTALAEECGHAGAGPNLGGLVQPMHQPIPIEASSSVRQ